MSGAKRARNPRGGKRKKKKDPNAPKRPRSAYILYCTDSREEVKKANDGAKPAELMQMMGAMWNALPAHKKQEYNDKAKEDKARYIEQMKGYTAPGDDDDDEDDGGGRRKRGKKQKDPSEPKRSPSAYLLYGQKIREEVKAANPEAKSSEIMKIIGARWQKLGEEEKKPYVDEAAQLKSQYDDAKASYKKKAVAADDDGGKDDDDDDGDDGGDGGGDDDDDDEE